MNGERLSGRTGKDCRDEWGKIVGYDDKFCLTVNTLDRDVGWMSVVMGSVDGPLCVPSVTYRCLSPEHMDFTFRLIGCNRSSSAVSSLPQKSVENKNKRSTHVNSLKCVFFFKI